jgi:uncharacterized damage-inducible protein DinB
MSTSTLREVWLGGPIEGVPAVLQPAAHAFVSVSEEVAVVAAPLTGDELWKKAGDAASPGFHLQHIVGSTDRLLAYARGEQLNDAQKAFARAEGKPGEPAATAASLIADVQKAMADAVDILRGTNPETVTDTRGVGRAQLPTTVLGLLFHAAEHAQRHAGQLTTTIKIIRAGTGG